MKPIDIYIDLTDAFNAGDHRKAWEMAADLGIKFKRGEGQMMTDGYRLLDCTNIPDNLPPYITPYERDK